MSGDEGIRSLLAASAERLLREHCTQQTVEAAKRDGWSPALWAVVEQAQLPLVSIDERYGGAGGDVADMAAVLRLAGQFAAPLPLAETGLLAGWLLAASGRSVPSGPLAAAAADAGAVELERRGGRWLLRGELQRVPWAAVASRLVLLLQANGNGQVVSVAPQQCVLERECNLAWEPRDRVRFDAVALADDDVFAAGPGVTAEAFLQRGALARALLMVGALDRALALSIAHAGTRVQFGRPIGRFQAIQQELARFAGEVAAAAAAALSAAGAIGRGDAELAVASAKIRAGEAAATGAAIAHQVHAAIGVTEEYALHHSTLRLQAWRAEFGSERFWAERLGGRILAAGADGLWPLFTGA